MRQVNQVKLGAEFIADTAHRESNDRCLWAARMRRDKVAATMPEWEEMRQLASDVKEHTLSRLGEYLGMFEKNLQDLGVHVHRAANADEHNRIIYEIMHDHGVKTVTKGKSMTMDECGMREYLEERGIQINESDLGERIQQLDGQRDSHIVMPAIHKLRDDVARIFADKLGSDPHKTDPKYLNSVMRRDMRGRYVKADAGMIGVNYALADTGTIAMCSNEGDVDICAVTPPLLIVSMGIEKVIPTQKELALFVRLLSRSSLGYDITQYTSHLRGPREGQEMHVVILDNGRSSRLGETYWPVLKCIRCGTCMNTCPVFRRTSGISYDAPYMGPLGLILMPSYDLHRYARLPYSCTHCGSCGDVCPVKIPIPELIFYWREVVVKRHETLFTHDAEEAAMTLVLKSAANLQKAERLGLWALRNTPVGLAQSAVNPWAKWHDDPVAQKETFRQWYKRNVGPLDETKRTAPGQENAKKDCTGLPKEIGSMPNPYASSQPKARPLPEIPVFDIPGSPLPNFICHLKGFDGDYRLFRTREAAAEWLQERLPKDGRKIFSSVPDVTGNVALPDFKTPAEMNVIDVCVGDSLLSVGETGSVLVDVSTLGDPAAALFSTDLYLFVDRAKMLPGMQEAYAKMDMKSMQYSSFFSGPSATADIEAVHITGAQAQISLTALVYGCTPEDEKAVKEMMTRLPQGTPLGQPDAPVLKLVRPADPSTGQDSV